MQASFDPFETPFGPEIDAKVDEMIAWADTDDDGLISFDEELFLCTPCTPCVLTGFFPKSPPTDFAHRGAKSK